MDDYTVTGERFEQQMLWLQRQGWHPTSLQNLLPDKIQNLPERSVVITFDDGFASNRQHAWPVLDQLRFPASTFVVTDRLGSRNSWDGEGRDHYPLLSGEDIAVADRQLMTFHSHSKSHPDLPSLTRDELLEELRGSKHTLSRMGLDTSFFAYPFGRWNWQVVDAVRDVGFRGACSCLQGLNGVRTNPLLLRRVEVRNEDVGWRFQSKVTTGRDWTTWPPDRPEWLRQVRSRMRRHFGVEGNRS